MATIDCAMGDRLTFGDDICIQLTDSANGQLHVFVDAARIHRFEGCGGFHVSAPCGGRHRAHVLVLRDGNEFVIGSVRVRILRVCNEQMGAQALRSVRLQIEAPMAMVRTALPRSRRRPRSRAKDASCWS